MRRQIVITEWAFQSYLDLKSSRVFTEEEYWDTLRPDVERLRDFPTDPKFGNSHFWGPATLRNGEVVPDGYKMKWHNVGYGAVQLRLCVAVLDHSYLMQAYVKDGMAIDKREAAKLADRIKDIKAGKYRFRGKL